MKFAIISFLLFLSLSSCVAQKHNSYSQNYKKGKELMENGAYGEAMSILLSLSIESAENRVYKDASYLYALSALKDGKYAEGLQMLKQIEVKYPEYYTDEVKYHQAVSYFYLKEYDKALLTCSKLSSKYKKDIANLKFNFINQYKDTDKLAELYDRNKEDKDVAYILYKKLGAKNPKTNTERDRISALRSKFGFEELKNEIGSGGAVKNIGVLLPYYTLGANSSSNNIFYDFHAGLKMAFDSLNKDGERVKVHYFSIEKDTNRFLTFLNSDDFKYLDLVVGPVYSNLGTIAFEYNIFNKNTVIVNPFSNYIKNGSSCDQVVFNSPLVETIGTKTAEMCVREFLPKKAVVLYAPNVKDSISAVSFKAAYEKGKGKIIAYKALNKANMYNVNKFITDKNKDSIGVVVVFASDAMSATNVLTAIEVVNCKAPIVAPKDWLEITSLTLQKYQKHNTHFIFPNYYSADSPRIKKFTYKYFKTNNLYPSEFSYVGYDLGLFFGQKLITYGENFTQSIKKEGGDYNYLLQGYDYSNSNNNQALQFVKFEDNKLVPLIDFNK